MRKTFKKVTAFALAVAMAIPMMGIGVKAATWSAIRTDLTPGDITVDTVAGVKVGEYDAVYEFTIPTLDEGESYAKDYQNHWSAPVKADTQYELSVGIELLSGDTETDKNGLYYFIQTVTGYYGVLQTTAYQQSALKAYTESGTNYKYNTYTFYSNNPTKGNSEYTTYSAGGIRMNVHNRDYNAGAHTVIGLKMRESAYKVTSGDNVAVSTDLIANDTEGDYIAANDTVEFTVTEGYTPSVTVAGVAVAPTETAGTYTVTASGPVVINAVKPYDITIAGEAYKADYNAKVTVTDSSTRFAYWTKNGKVVSTNSTYSFYAWENADIQSVHEGDEDYVEAYKAYTQIIYMTADVADDATTVYVEYYDKNQEAGWYGCYFGATENPGWSAGKNNYATVDYTTANQMVCKINGVGENTLYFNAQCGVQLLGSTAGDATVWHAAQ
ncbi:MAG: hypothetical protein ACI4CT_08525 [Lachnospiraceae bacterium]